MGGGNGGFFEFVFKLLYGGGLFLVMGLFEKLVFFFGRIWRVLFFVGFMLELFVFVFCKWSM